MYDSDLMKYLLIFTRVYELYYLDENADFCSKIIKPTEGYAYTITQVRFYFIHAFSNEFDNSTSYIDVFTSDMIYHLIINLIKYLIQQIIYLGSASFSWKSYSRKI